MKKLLILGLLALMMACHSASAPSNSTADSSKTAQKEAPIDTLATIVARVQQQSRLYAADCMVHKVVLFTDKSQIDGGLVKFNKVGYRKIAIPIDVTLKGYIDFADFSADNVSREGDLLVITLPDPKVMLTASKIDHKKARQYVSPRGGQHPSPRCEFWNCGIGTHLGSTHTGAYRHPTRICRKQCSSAFPQRFQRI